MKDYIYKPMHKKFYKIIIITCILLIALASCPVYADQEQVDWGESEAYDLRMQYTEKLIQQDAYSSRMDYYEEMEEKYSIRNRIVDYALSFVGVTPYVLGGGDLYWGTDCSGFIFLIYGTFGIWLATGSDAYQYWVGRHIAPEERLPGDIIVYDFGQHVAIYAGNDMVVHCSSEENGTVCWPWDYRNITAVVRVIE